MNGYLGEKIINIQESEFKDYTPSDWAMYFIERYGHIDGDHHKLWVIDQIARIIKGSEIILKQASWDNGETNWRVSLGEPTEIYKQWVIDMKNGEDGPETYSYDCGIAP